MTGKPRVGIAGVGLMGHGICHQLLEKDYTVSVLGHKRRERIDDVVQAGAVEQPNMAALAAASDVTFIIVPPTAVMAAGEAALAAAGPDTMTAVLSTCNPGITEALSAKAEAAGIAFFEACMLNGPPNARDGSLQLIAAGPDAVLARAALLPSDIAERVHQVGPVGSAQRIKVFNNAIYNVGMAMACEIAAHADIQGIDMGQFLDIVQGGGTALSAVERGLVRINDADAPTLARVANGRNVFKAYLDVARQAGAATPVADGAFSVFEAAMEAGLMDEDQTKMSAMLRGQAGKVGPQ
jgi:3-hydroxyisobutyrate dehydrogenase-like beta-hydroxyacid dehydrogenase